MIISHAHEFIFFKARKVAGTSVEIALAQHCEIGDVVTPIQEYSPDKDHDSYHHQARNYLGLNEHTTPESLMHQLSGYLPDYHSIAIVRNPWDMVVSRWFWNINGPELPPLPMRIINTIKEGRLNLDKIISYPRIARMRSNWNTFQGLMENFPEEFTNNDYYFAPDGTPYPFRFLRFESLQADYNELCDDLGLLRTQLPRTKSMYRKKSSGEMHTPETIDLVREIFKKQIEHFGYEPPKI